MYAVRVYNTALTQADINWNHFVDILAYNSVDLSLFEGVEQTILNSIATTYANVSVEEADVSDLAIVIEKAQINSTTDYASMYVGADGSATANGATLVGLFTAFKNEKEAIEADVAAGKWTNKMDETGATNANLFDTYADGAWGVASSNGGLSMGLTGTNWKAAKDTNTGIVFNTDWAAYANLTVEEASVAHGAHTGNTSVGAYENGVTFKIDLLRGTHHANLDCTGSERYSNGGINMKTVWMANTTDAWWAGARDATPQALFTRNGAEAVGRTMSYIKTTTDTAVTFTVRHANSAVFDFKNGSYTLEEYEAAKSGRAFYMFAKAAMDTYAVRVYNGLLTNAEMQYNHLIDLLAFYQVEVAEDLTTEMLASLAGSYVATTFVYDDNGSGDDYTAVRAQLAADLELAAALAAPATHSEYDDLYAAQDHLIGLYTAFDGADDSVSLLYGVWKNKVVGKTNATLYDATDKVDWTLGENGGLSLNIADKATWNGITATGAGIRLDESWADLANFTVETSHLTRAIAAPKDTTDTATSGGFNLGSEVPASGADNKAKFEETFCLDMISSANYFNLYNNNGLRMGFITRMEGVATGTWWTTHGRSSAYSALVPAVDSANAGLTLVYTKATDDANVTFGMSFSTGAAAMIDAGGAAGAKGSYAYTLEEYASVKEAAVITTHKFSLYNRGMYDVYAIRVYDKVLNAEEMAQNHFVDLLAFYGIDVPAGLTADGFAPFAALAAECATIPFYADAAKAAEACATIEEGIAAIDKLVILDSEGEVITTVFAQDGACVLPSVIEGYTVVSYLDGATWGYAYPGQKVAVEGEQFYYAMHTEAPAITTDETVDIRVVTKTEGDATVVDKLGIRFNATVDMAAIADLLDTMNDGVAEEDKVVIRNFGMLIAPKAYVEAAGEFTAAALDAWAAKMGSTVGAYVAISSEDWRDATDPSAYKLSASLVDFSEATLLKNPEFAAIAFIELDMDEDDYSDVIVYGTYDEDTCVSVKDVVAAAVALKEDEGASLEEDAEYAALKALLAEFPTEE